MHPAPDFWEMLVKYGLTPTPRYTADGKSRFVRKPDGELMVVSVHDAYPDYIIDKVLDEAGMMHVPLYNNRDL